MIYKKRKYISLRDISKKADPCSIIPLTPFFLFKIGLPGCSVAHFAGVLEVSSF